jgi:hypothetical protein
MRCFVFLPVLRNVLLRKCSLTVSVVVFPILTAVVVEGIVMVALEMLIGVLEEDLMVDLMMNVGLRILGFRILISLRGLMRWIIGLR